MQLLDHDWSVLDCKGRLIQSFDSYAECIEFLLNTSIGSKFKVEPLFFKPYEVKVSRVCKVVYRTISSGGISIEKTYTFNVEKLQKEKRGGKKI